MTEDNNTLFEGNEEETSQNTTENTTASNIINGTEGNDTLNGTSGDDLLKGGAGDDILRGNDGADSFEGGDGNDYLYADKDDLSIDGGDGTDSLILHSIVENVTVSLDDEDGEGALYVEGMKGADIYNIENIYAGAGDDTLIGNSASNGLHGGEGADTLYGMDGDDAIYGDGGGDTYYGGAGNDELHGHLEDVLVDGGEGSDFYRLHTQTTNLTITLGDDGEAGQVTYADGQVGATLYNIEKLHTGSGDDTLIGNSDDNRLIGGAGADILYGMDGHDAIYGDGGGDTYYGGEGNDELHGHLEDILVDGGEGSDFYRLHTQTANLTVTLGDDGEAGQVIHDGVAGATLYNIENLHTGSGDDTLIGNNDGNKLLGGEGADTLYGMGGMDVLYGGAGDDTIHSGGGGDYYYGEAGDDMLHGHSDDKLVNGGEGTDSYYLSDQTADLDIVLGEEGKEAIISYDGREATKLYDVENLYAGSGNDRLLGNSADNILDGGAGADRLRGGAGADTLYGMDGGDAIYGDGGGDTYYGGAGNDELHGHLEDILVDGGEGTDFYRLHTQTANLTVVLADDGEAGQVVYDEQFGATLYNIEKLHTGSGDDTLIGNSDDNRLIGGAGADTLYGMDGHDTIYGDGGGDTYYGGAGNDELHGHLEDILVDGGEGSDFYRLHTQTANLTVTLADEGEAGQVTYADGQDGATLYNIEKLHTGSGDDTLIGNNDDNRLIGGAGADTLYGMGGGDVIFGDGGGDTYYGGAGNDELYGHFDDVLVDGGEGSDFYRLHTQTANLTITLGDEGEAGQVTYDGQAGAELYNIEKLHTGSGDDEVTGNSANNRIITGAGDDTINGGAGNDALYGGEGSDIYHFTLGEGSDVIYEEYDANQLGVDGLAGTIVLDMEAYQIETVYDGNDLVLYFRNADGTFSGDQVRIKDALIEIEGETKIKDSLRFQLKTGEVLDFTSQSDAYKLTILQAGEIEDGYLNSSELEDGTVEVYLLIPDGAAAGDVVHFASEYETGTMETSTLTLSAQNIADGNVKAEIDADLFSAGEGDFTLTARLSRGGVWLGESSDDYFITRDSFAAEETKIVAYDYLPDTEVADREVNTEEFEGGVTANVEIGNGAQVGDTLRMIARTALDDVYTHDHILTADDLTQGTIFITLPQTLFGAGDDEYDLAAQIIDPAGNESLVEAAMVVTLDTTAPQAPIFLDKPYNVPVADIADGYLNAEELIDDALVYIDLDTNNVVGDLIIVYGQSEEGGAFEHQHIVTEDDIVQGHATLGLPASHFLQDGSYNLTAKIIDPVGNESPLSEVKSLIVDTGIMGEINIVNNVEELDEDSSVNASEMADDKVRIRVDLLQSNANANDSLNITVTQIEGSGQTGQSFILTAQDITAGFVTIDLEADLFAGGDQYYELRAQITDNAGNESKVSATAILLDTTIGTPDIHIGDTDDMNLGEAGDGYVNLREIKDGATLQVDFGQGAAEGDLVAISVVDEEGQTHSYDYYLNAEDAKAQAALINLPAAYIIDSGNYEITATIQDEVGNRAVSTPKTLIVDIDPILAVPKFILEGSSGGFVDAEIDDGEVNAAEVADGSISANIRLNGQTTVQAGDWVRLQVRDSDGNAYEEFFELTAQNIADDYIRVDFSSNLFGGSDTVIEGDYELRAFITDDAGNESIFSPAHLVTVSTQIEAPEILLEADFEPISAGFFTGDNMLSQTIPNGGDLHQFTFSSWVKPDDSTQSNFIWMDVQEHDYDQTPLYDGLRIEGGNLRVIFNSFDLDFTVTPDQPLGADAWQHVVLMVDTTQVDPAMRIQLYLNGELWQAPDGVVEDYPDQDAELRFAGQYGISRKITPYNTYDDDGTPGIYPKASGYEGGLSDIHFLDGQNSLIEDFGYFDKDGVWRASIYDGPHGPTGVHLDFSNSDAPYEDATSNGNDFTQIGTELETGDGTVLEVSNSNEIRDLYINQIEKTGGVTTEISLGEGLAVGDTLLLEVTDHKKIVRRHKHILNEEQISDQRLDITFDEAFFIAGDGKYTVHARAFDAAGNLSDWSDSVDVILDQEISTGEVAIETTGTEIEDGYLNAEEFADGADVVVSFDPNGLVAGDIIELTSVSDDGGTRIHKYTLTDTDLIASQATINMPQDRFLASDATYQLSAKLIDQAGNETERSSIIQVIIDQEIGIPDLEKSAVYHPVNSALFSGDDGLTLGASSNWDGQNFTFSSWVKPYDSLSDNLLWTAPETYHTETISINDGALNISFPGVYDNTGAAINWTIKPEGGFKNREYAHIYLNFDLGNEDPTNRVHAYIDGVRYNAEAELSGSLGRYGNGFTGVQYIGRYGSTNEFRGELSETYLINGQSTKIEDFGYFKDGAWRPSVYDGYLGDEGMYLEFKDPENLGKDSSYNENHVTVSDTLEASEGVAFEYEGHNEIEDNMLNAKEIENAVSTLVMLGENATEGDTLTIEITGDTGTVHTHIVLINEVQAQDGHAIVALPTEAFLNDDKILTDGEYRLRAKIGDKAGNTSDYSEEKLITLDTNVPQNAPEILEIGEIVDGYINAVEIEEGVQLTLEIDSANIEIGDQLEVTLYDLEENTNSYQATTTIEFTLDTNHLSSGQIEITIDQNYFGEDGQYQIATKVIDTAGNASPASTPKTLRLDRIANMPEISPNEAVETGDGLINLAEAQSGITVAVTLGEETKAGDALIFSQLGEEATSFTYLLTDDDLMQDSVTVNLNPSLFPEIYSEDGAITEVNEANYQIQVELQDEAGNTSPISPSYSIVFDTLSPKGLPELSFNGTSADDGVISQQELNDGIVATVDFSTDGVAVGDYVEITIHLNDNEVNVISVILDQAALNAQSIDVSIPSDQINQGDGNYNFYATIKDEAGNRSEASIPRLLKVKTAIDAPVFSKVEAEIADGGINIEELEGGVAAAIELSNGVASGDTLEIKVKAPDGSETTQQHIISMSDVGRGYSQVYLENSLFTGQGNYQFEARIFDAFGNQSNVSDAYNVLLDTIFPDLSPSILKEEAELSTGKINATIFEDGVDVAIDLNQSGFQSGDMLTIKVQAQDNGAIQSFDYAITAQDIAVGKTTIKLPTSIFPFDETRYYISTELTDQVGNTHDVLSARTWVDLDISLGNAVINGNMLDLADGYVNQNEFNHGILVKITLSGIRREGDSVNFEITAPDGSTQIYHHILNDKEVYVPENGDSYSINITLPERLFPDQGSYSVSSWLSDPAGNEATKSEAANFILDTLVPGGMPSINLVASELENGFVNQKAFEDGISVEIELTGNNIEVGDFVRLEILATGENTSYTQFVTLTNEQITNGRLTVAISQDQFNFGDGEYTLSGYLTDIAGNKTQSMPVRIELDTTVNHASFLINPIGGEVIDNNYNTISEVGDGYINLAETKGGATLALQPGSDSKAGDQIIVEILNSNGVTIANLTHALSQQEITNNRFDLTIPEDFLEELTDGTYGVKTLTNDIAGNQSQTSKVSYFILDTQVPGTSASGDEDPEALLAPEILWELTEIEDGNISYNEFTDGVAIQVQINGTRIEAGDTLRINIRNQDGVEQYYDHKLNANEIIDGAIVDLNIPTDYFSTNNSYYIGAILHDDAGNQSAQSYEIKLKIDDQLAAPIIQIGDGYQDVAEAGDGYINKLEREDGYDVGIELGSGTDTGDILFVQIRDSFGDITSHQHIISQSEADQGSVVINLDEDYFSLGEDTYDISAYVTDFKNDTSELAIAKELTLDFTGPNEAPKILIDSTDLNDFYINRAEHDDAVMVRVAVPTEGVEEGDSLYIYATRDGETFTHEHYLTKEDLSAISESENGKAEINLYLDPDVFRKYYYDKYGSSIGWLTRETTYSFTAQVSDAAGNLSPVSEEIHAELDTIAIQTSIDTSEGDLEDGYINQSELAGGVQIDVSIPSLTRRLKYYAIDTVYNKAGDTLYLTMRDHAGNVYEFNRILTQNEIDAETASFNIPEGMISSVGDGAFDFSSYLIDPAGNRTEISTVVPITVDTIGPEKAPIILNQGEIIDGAVNIAEFSDGVNIVVSLDDSNIFAGDSLYIEITGENETTEMMQYVLTDDDLQSQSTEINITLAQELFADPDMNYTLTAWAEDNAGNRSITSSPVSFYLNNLLETPLIKVGDSSSELSDQFINANEAQNGITMAVELGVGTEAGDILHIELRHEDDTIHTITHRVLATEADNGSVDLILDSNLFQDDEATYYLTSWASDSDGNITDRSVMLEVIVDKNGPQGTPVIVEALSEFDDGIVDKQEFADNVTLHVEFASEGVSIGDYVLLEIKDTNSGEVTAHKHYLTVIDVIKSYVDVTIDQTKFIALESDYEITAQLFDPAGNMSNQSEPVNFTLDALLETPTILVGGMDTDDNEIADGYINAAESADGNASIKVQLNEGTHAGDTLYLTVQLNDGDDVVYEHIIDAEDEDAQAAIVDINITDFASGDGTYHLSANVVDQAGNQSDYSNAVSVILDRVGPTTPPVLVTEESEIEADTYININEITDGLSLTYSFDSTGLAEGDYLRLTFTNPDSTTSTHSFTHDILLTAQNIEDGRVATLTPRYEFFNTEDGNYTVQAELLDKAGNSSGISDSASFILDTEISDQPAVGGLDLADRYVNANEYADGLHFTITPKKGTSPGDIIYLEVTDQNGNKAQTTFVLEADQLIWVEAEQTFEPVELFASNQIFNAMNGVYDFTARIEDAAGNVSETSPTWSAILDTTIPQIAPVFLSQDSEIDDGRINANEISDGLNLNLQLDKEGIESGDSLYIEVTDSNGTVQTHEHRLTDESMPDSGTFNIAVRIDQSLFPADGDYQISAYVKDAAGNQGPSSDTQAVTLNAILEAPRFNTTTLSFYDETDPLNEGGDGYINYNESLDGKASFKVELGEGTDIGDRLVINVSHDAQTLHTDSYTVTETDVAQGYAIIELQDNDLFTHDTSYDLVAWAEDDDGNQSDYSSVLRVEVDVEDPQNAPVIRSDYSEFADGAVNIDEFADGLATFIEFDTNNLEVGDALAVTLNQKDSDSQTIYREYRITEDDLSLGGKMLLLEQDLFATMEADYELSAWLQDEALNRSPVSEPVEFKLDNLLTSPTILGDSYGGDSNEIADGIINANEAIDGTTTLYIDLGEGANIGDSLWISSVDRIGQSYQYEYILSADDTSDGVATLNLDDQFFHSTLSNNSGDGEYDFYAWHTDQAGNQSAQSSPFAVYVDRTAPTGGVTYAIDDTELEDLYVNQNEFADGVNIALEIDEPVEVGDIIQLKIDYDDTSPSDTKIWTRTITEADLNSEVTQGLGSILLSVPQFNFLRDTGYNDGRYNLTVSVTDEAGNTSGHEDSLVIEIDTLIDTPEIQTDIGEIGDQYLNINELSDDVVEMQIRLGDVRSIYPTVRHGDQLRIAVTDEHANTEYQYVTLTEDNIIIGTDESQTVNIDLDANNFTAGDGQYSLKVALIDVAGNIGESANTHWVEIDTVISPDAPQIISNALEHDDDIADGFISNTEYNDGVSVTLQIDGEGLEGGDELWVAIEAEDGTIQQQSFSLNEISDQFDVIINLDAENFANGDGTYSLTAYTGDVAGNRSPISDIRSVILDTTAIEPTIAVVEGIAYEAPDFTLVSKDEMIDGLDLQLTLDPNLAAGNSPSTAGDRLSFWVADGLGNGQFVDYVLTEADIEAGLVNYTLEYSLFEALSQQDDGSLTEGRYSVAVELVDTLGNQSEYGTASMIEIDFGAPDAPIIQQSVADIEDGYVTEDELADGNIDITITLPDNGVAGDKLTLYATSELTGEVISYDHYLSVYDVGNGNVEFNLPSYLFLSDGQYLDGRYQLNATLSDIYGNESDRSAAYTIELITSESGGTHNCGETEESTVKAGLYFSENGGVVRTKVDDFVTDAFTVQLSFTLDIEHACLFAYTVPGSGDEFEIYHSQNSYYGLNFRINGEWHFSKQTLDDPSQLTNLVITWDSTTGELRVYHDEELFYSVQDYQTGNPISEGGVITLGQQQYSYDNYPTGNDSENFEGTYYDVKLWDEHFTQEEIVNGLDDSVAILNYDMGSLQNGVMDVGSGYIGEATGNVTLRYDGTYLQDDISGSDDNELIYGYEGDDQLNGNDGNDGLYGGDGNDNLYGGNGDDTLQGGIGSDLFVFDEYNADDHDVIEDFNASEYDIIDLTAFEDITNFSDIQNLMVESQGDVILQLKNNYTITIKNHEMSDLDQRNFIFSGNNDERQAVKTGLYFAANGGVIRTKVDDFVTNAFTLQLNFALDGYKACLFSYTVPNSGDEFEVFYNPSSSIGLAFRINNDWHFSKQTLDNPSQSNNLFITWDSTTGELSVYKDEELFYQVQNYQTGNPISEGGVITLGQQQYSYDNYPTGNDSENFEGTYYDVKLWDEHFTQEEIVNGLDDSVAILNYDMGSLQNGVMDVGSGYIGEATGNVTLRYDGTYLQDDISGSDDNELIYGYEGDDQLNGNDGNDGLYGGDGNDNLYGGNGDDTLQGGIGSDLFVFDEYNADDHDVIEDFNASEYDIIDLTAFEELTSFATLQTLMTESNGDVTIQLNEDYSFEIKDIAIADLTVDHFSLVANTTCVNGSDAYDYLVGSDGSDTLNGYAGYDYLVGNAGNDTLNGGEGYDYLVGGEGNDNLYGGDGFDNLEGGVGNDVYYGGAGADYFMIDEYNAGDEDRIADFNSSEGDFIDLTAFADITDFASLTALMEQSNDDVIIHLNQDYSVVISDTQTTDLTADDFIFIDDNKYYEDENGDEVHYTSEEYFWVDGNDGNDALYGGEANNELDGQDGNDTLYGGEGDDYIYSGYGDDTLYGGEGNDYLEGGYGDDILYGGEGNDWLFGENGENELYGGEGDDELVGSDNGDDKLFGGEGYDVLRGYDGDDTLYGGEGDDTLYGNNGNDTLYGGAGDDNLYSYSGNDILNGGEGSDLFIFDDDYNSGVHGIIEDFNASEHDFIDLSRFEELTSFESLQNLMVQNQEDVMIQVRDDYTITVKNHEIDDLTAMNFVLAGNDEVDGATIKTGLYFNQEGGVVRTKVDHFVTNAFTLQLGFMLDSEQANLFSYAVPDSDDEFEVFYDASSTKGLYFNINGETHYSGQTLDDPSQLTNLIITWDSTTGGLNVYQDGELFYTIQDYQTGNSISEGGVVTLGQQQESYDTYSIGNDDDFEGTYYDVKLWDQQFTQEAISDGLDASTAILNYDMESLQDGIMDAGNGYIGETSGNVKLRYDGTYLYDTIQGSNGDDVIYGYARRDNLYGNDGDDTLYGGEGDDYLGGGDGNDTLYGGEGDDTYLFERTSGYDTIQETSGADILNFDWDIDYDQLWFQQQDNDLLISVIGTEANITIRNWYDTSDPAVDYIVETIYDKNDVSLSSDSVASLVEAMAAFDPPALGETTLSDEYQDALMPIINEAWNKD